MYEEDDEAQQDRIYKFNEKFLDAFYKHLTVDKKLTKKTGLDHMSRVDFFGNNFACDYEGVTLDHAIPFISEYLGSWFIRKCMWSTPKAIKENITSFKKFYVWMQQEEHISQQTLDDLLLIFKKEKEEWLDTCTKYNDPEGGFDIEDLFPW